jgi:hypothetical protein
VSVIAMGRMVGCTWAGPSHSGRNRDLEKEKWGRKISQTKKQIGPHTCAFYCQVEKNSFFYFSAAKNTSPMK